LLAKESTSSIKIMLGFYYRAVLNNLLINRSDSPICLHIKSAEETLKNVPLSIAVAHAFAK
jgi:hypothetical protein